MNTAYTEPHPILLKPSRPVGIVGYGAYVPRYRLPATEVARIWAGAEAGLPIKEKSVPGLDEDVATMSIEAARNALRILEERPLLEDLLTRTVFNNELGGVQVLIGGEGTWLELRDCSMVLSRYGVPGLATGMLGVLGPIRMPYGRTISTVRFVAGLLSDLVTDLHAE